MGKAARLVGARAGQQEAGDPFHRQVGDGLISNPKPALQELFRIMHAIAELLGGEAAELQADAHTPIVPRKPLVSSPARSPKLPRSSSPCLSLHHPFPYYGGTFLALPWLVFRNGACRRACFFL